MLALTGIVFSLTFVMVQFSSTAYSPRLVYGVVEFAGVDRSGSSQVPFFSVWVELAIMLLDTPSPASKISATRSAGS
jgi:uncharacterized membrane protein